MIASSRNYAIGMVHFQIIGGWRMLISVLTAYFLLFAGGVSLYYYAQYATDRAVIRPLPPETLILLLAFEAIVLVFFGGYRVSSAIRTDITTRMIESNRLMPVPNWRALLGYIFGASSHALGFALFNLLLCLGVAWHTGASVQHLLTNQIVLFAFAMFVWSFIALGTFIYRHMFFIAMALIFLTLCTRAIVLVYLGFPAVTLLLTPFIGETAFVPGAAAFGPGAAGPSVNWAYAVAIAGQAAFFAVFFAGACRRYRGTYPTTFNIPQALLLLACWGAVSAVGIRYFDDIHVTIRRMRFGMGEGLTDAQIIASLLAALLLALIPLWTAVRTAQRRPLLPPLFLGIVSASALLTTLPALGAHYVDAFPYAKLLLTFLVVAAQVAAAALGFHLLRNKRPYLNAILMAAGLLVLWIGPLLLELIRVLILLRRGIEGSFSALGALSPIGAFISIWSLPEPPSLIPGLIWQWLVVALLLALALFRRGAPTGPAAPLLVAPPPLTSAPPAPGSS